MTGSVDDLHRALIEVHVRATPGAATSAVTAWIDTAFNGFFVFSSDLVQQLNLEQLATTEAILADGKKVVLESFICYLEWFDKVIPAQVVVNEGRIPLLGTELLAGRVLHIDYQQRQLSLV